ncbi:hypothetical protein MTYP_02261 [Methylophilaceae bacterium]|nr:hypothetical protein MTYP_02261 [Methylophilaceae bacterium]
MGYMLRLLVFILIFPATQVACAATKMPPIDHASALYEVPVEPGVTYEDVIFSLKTVSEGMNFVNPMNFPIAEHMKLRGLQPEEPLEVRTYCNLGLGTEIMLDHPEFSVFAPCRIAIYRRQGKLYLGLDRPTFDLKSIRNPTERARKSAQELEDVLIGMMDKARKGDF